MVTVITFSQAVTGFAMAAAARRLSPHTLADYQNTFRKLFAFLEQDLPLADITRDTITAFLASQSVSGKTLLNYHTGLSALWAWAAAEGIVPANLIHQVPRPHHEQRVIQPLTESEIRSLLSALTYTNSIQQPGKRSARRRLPDADRNLAILLLLLDTGLRASELCALTIARLDLRSPNKSVMVHNGKGGKDRQIPISARTGQALWRYLSARKESRLNEPLFATANRRPLDRTQLRKMLSLAGDRAGVLNVHPHRLRHTFAIYYLRNGGDIYTLQMILGHSTLETVRAYLQIAQADLDSAHRRASPVENMHL